MMSFFLFVSAAECVLPLRSITHVLTLFVLSLHMLSTVCNVDTLYNGHTQTHSETKTHTHTHTGTLSNSAALQLPNVCV